MKSSKLILIFSELSSNEQLVLSKKCLIKAFEQIKSKISLDEILNGIQDCNINENVELENCVIEILANADKSRVSKSIVDAINYNNALVVYVGEVTVPFGQWILQDGIFHSNNLLSLLNDNDKIKDTFILATSAPCEDWQIVEKKHAVSFHLCNYNVDDDIPSDEVVTGINRFADGVVAMLKVSPKPSYESGLLSAIVSRNPSIYLFLDKGSSSVPALFTLDGFAMLLNCGFNRNPDSRRYLKYYQQIDVALLSHISYNNFLGLNSYTPDDCNTRINHLFLPGEISISEKVSSVNSNPFCIDLRSYMSSMITELKDRGMQCSTLALKGKSGTPITANHVKPIQLFHKIGYGSLELIPLSPFDEDPDMKKFADEWKKSKYANDSIVKNLPSVSILIVWKPFNNKIPIKRILYVGAKCPLKKYWPSVITALHSTYDFLKQAEFVPSQGTVKKPASAPPRKAAPAAAAAPAKPSKTGDNVVNNSATNTKKPAAGPTGSGDKPSSRPATSNVSSSANNSKEASTKRPQTAGNKTKPEGTKSQETKKPAATSVKATVATSGPTKKTQLKKTESKPQVKEAVTQNKKSKTHPAPVSNGTKVHATPMSNEKSDEFHNAPHIDENETNKPHAATDQIDGIIRCGTEANGVLEHEENSEDHISESHEPDKLAVDDNVDHQLDSPNVKSAADASKFVAVGTVECAITEHGEADFCDDTPEEVSADQLRDLELDDDDDDERGHSSQPYEGDAESGEPGVGNLAHLPMEGSFYGKETVDGVANDAIGGLDWNQPLAMPMPAKAMDGGSTAKKSAKCSTPIHVDCLLVPSDLDKDDLRYLFECVKFETVFFQLENPSELVKSLEILLEEKEKNGTHTSDITVIPGLADESYLNWAVTNNARLKECRLEITTDLSRRSITTGSPADSNQGEETCFGMKLEF